MSSRPRAVSASIPTSCLQNDIQGAGKGASEPINRETDRSRPEKEKHEGPIKNKNPDPRKTAWRRRAGTQRLGCDYWIMEEKQESGQEEAGRFKRCSLLASESQRSSQQAEISWWRP